LHHVSSANPPSVPSSAAFNSIFSEELDQECVVRFDAVLPLKAFNTSRGSDLHRVANVLLPSMVLSGLDRLVRNLIVVSPKSDIEQVALTLERFNSLLSIQFVDESEILGGITMPASLSSPGWYIQQIIKLSISRFVETDFYLTLDSDLIFGSRILECFRGRSRMPFHPESFADHPDWWRASSAALECAIASASKPVMGVTPALLNVDVVHGLLGRLDYLGSIRGGSDWKSYLLGFPVNGLYTWTEYTLYWTFLEGESIVESIHYPADIYSFFHSADELLGTLRHDPGRPCFVSQSSFISERDHVAAYEQVFGRYAG